MILRSNSLLLSPILAPLLMLLLWSGCGGNGHDEGPRFSQEDMSSQLVLKEDWAIQSAAEVPENGEVISTAGFSPQNWFPTSVPSTVLAALVENNVYPDPYFAMNLRSIPGTTYPLGVNFSNFPIPLDSPFRSSWWYRTEFFLPEDYSERTIYLHFNGINFRANIWVNGILIADSKKVAGTYRVYEFNITNLALPGEANCLAVEVFPPKVLDLAHTWVDWNPMPPDKDMGIWREAYLTTSGPVALRDTQVITDVDTPSLKAAHLTIYTEVLNTTDQPLKGTLQGDIEGIEFSRTVDLGPQESRRVTFSPEESSQLTFSRPRVWWPAQLGSQPLYDLQMVFELDGKVSDRRSVRFGIREVSSDLNEHGYRLFKINGENILIRGAGWTPDMMFRSSPEREETEIRYVRDLNLNAIRLEGKLGSDHLLDLCDTYGILVIAGWCCCDQWERWFLWDDEDYTVAAESLKSQLLRLRNHPSLIAWLNGSDGHPPQDVEQMYIDILESDTFR